MGMPRDWRPSIRTTWPSYTWWWAAIPKSEKSGHYGKGKLAILNTTTGKIEPGKEIEAGYFPHTVRYFNHKLYVTILGEDKLNVYDYPSLNLRKSLNDLGIGKTPQDICPDPQANRLYVVNTGSDNLSVVDAGKDEVVSEIAVGSHGEGFGCGPTSCAVDGDRLFVTLAYMNAVGIFDKREGKRLGFIPTGWYPTKVITGKEGVAVLSAKGIGADLSNGPSRPKVRGEYVLTLLKGTLGIIPADQIEANLPAWTRQVEEGAPIYGFRKGTMPPIRYVFFIVRENRTYDQVLGDLGRGNGDPYLTLFGEKITPNGHELARQFVTLDNYFANGEISVLGHSYTTSGYASPFMQLMSNLAYSDRYARLSVRMRSGVCLTEIPVGCAGGEEYRLSYIRGELLSLHQGGSASSRRASSLTATWPRSFMINFTPARWCWPRKMDRGKELYGHRALFQPQPDSVEKAKELLKNREVAQLISYYLLGDNSLVDQFGTNEKLRDEFANYLYHYPIGYPSWDLKISDLERVRVWKADFENQVKLWPGRGAISLYLASQRPYGRDRLGLPVALSVCGPKRCGPGPYHRHDLETSGHLERKPYSDNGRRCPKRTGSRGCHEDRGDWRQAPVSSGARW